MESTRQIMNDLDALNRCLHEQAEGAVGGPLHILTDDGNVNDSHVLYCWSDVEGEKDIVVRTLCREMLKLLIFLTYPQRIVWWLRTGIEKQGVNANVLALSVRRGMVINDSTNAGIYGSVIMAADGAVLWEGLEQIRSRKAGQK